MSAIEAKLRAYRNPCTERGQTVRRRSEASGFTDHPLGLVSTISTRWIRPFGPTRPAYDLEGFWKVNDPFYKLFGRLMGHNMGRQRLMSSANHPKAAFWGNPREIRDKGIGTKVSGSKNGYRMKLSWKQKELVLATRDDLNDRSHNHNGLGQVRVAAWPNPTWTR